ncbi:MAG: hypothetical protein N2234_09030 [Planctomycetota bacterium]|nr:hypothetical protein [Planctomycetota bacterium]
MKKLSNQTLKWLTVVVSIGVCVSLALKGTDTTVGFACGGLLYALCLKLQIRALTQLDKKRTASPPIKWALLRYGIVSSVALTVGYKFGLIAGALCVAMQFVGNLILILSAVAEKNVAEESAMSEEGTPDE